MDRAMTDRIEQQVRQAFPEGVIARVQVLQYGEDLEVEPGQAAMRVFFDWPGRSAGGQADPKTVHRFVTANAAALGVLGDGLPRVIEWVEFRPEGKAGAASPHGLAYRITGRGSAGRDQGGLACVRAAGQRQGREQGREQQAHVTYLTGTASHRLELRKAANRIVSQYQSLAVCVYPREQPHWYLAFIGVDPARQGYGVGAGLLRSRLRRLAVL